MTEWDRTGREIYLDSHLTVIFSCIPWPALYFVVFSHLISSKAPRQDPVVGVFGDTGEGAVDNFREAPLGDAFRDSSSVGAVGEGEELPIHPSSHLRDKQFVRLRCELRFMHLSKVSVCTLHLTIKHLKRFADKAELHKHRVKP